METQKRKLKGVVVSNKMMKTAVVKVTFVRRHPLYHKDYTVSRRFKAHDETNAYAVGDAVIIEATRPISKEKRWRIIGKV